MFLQAPEIDTQLLYAWDRVPSNFVDLCSPLHNHPDTLASSEATSNISLATTCKMGGTNYVPFLALTVTVGLGGQVSAQYNKDVAKYLPRKPCDSIQVSASPTQSEYQL